VRWQEHTVTQCTSEKAVVPSHNQLSNLANCVDLMDIPVFLNCFDSIKNTMKNTSNGNESVTAFPLEYPSFVKKDIREKFQDGLICKTPAWVITHCLEHLLTSGKRYTLSPCEVLELAKAANGAYLIVGYLNMKKRHVKLKDINKNVALGPLINYVLEDAKLGKKKPPPNIMSCVVYIPSTS